ncbi:MAG: transposase [Oscillospiraceae bacterium]|nr:transposase [Oscillospiraceae bacterium]
MDLPIRKHPRLKKYDYSQCGCYHITICVKNLSPILSCIVPAGTPDARAAVKLTPAGLVVEQYIQSIPNAYVGVQLVKYVIMPNHVHLLLALEQQPSTSIPTIVRSLKRMVGRTLGKPIWQDSYYDVVIRNDVMFQCEWEYIDSNPDKWAEDDLFVQTC